MSFSPKTVKLQATVFSFFLLISVFFAHTVSAQEWKEYGEMDSTYTAQDSAKWELRWAIRKDSSNLDLFRELIGLHKEQAEYEEELLVARAMVSANGGSAISHYMLGDAFLNNGLIRDGLNSMNQALSIDPMFVRAHTTMAEAYEMLHTYDSALIYLDSAIAINRRNIQAHIHRADILNRMGRPADAVESYESWAALSPDSFEPWLQYGRALLDVSQYEESISALTYAMSLDSNSASALFLLAQAQSGAGHIEKAIQSYTTFMFRYPTDQRALEAERQARALNWNPEE